jgi:hypothetical protein
MRLLLDLALVRMRRDGKRGRNRSLLYHEEIAQPWASRQTQEALW